MHDYKDPNNKSMKDVKEGLERVKKILQPYGYEVTVLADRGFGSTELFEYIDKMGWTYFIRVKGNYNIRIESDEVIGKIEDIEQYLKDKIVVSENKISPAGIKYPQIVEQEENQTINNITGTLKPSEQTELINQTEVKIATSSSLKRTYKWKKLNEESFKNSKYYTMFFNDGENTKRYWLSTREIYTASDYATFGIGCLRVWNYRWTTFV